MKKAFNKISRLFVLCFIGCFIILNDSCGLDTVLTVYPPNREHSIDDCATTVATEYANSFLSFSINTEGLPEHSFLGVDLYYKIYTNKSECQSEKSNLEGSANNNSTAYTSYDSMISKGYKALRRTGFHDEPLLYGDNRDPFVLRFVTTGSFNDPDNAFYSYVGPAKKTDASGAIDRITPIITYGDRKNYIPLRSLATNYQKEFSFDFGRNVYEEAGFKVKIPVSGDSDIKYSSFTDTNSYYVAVFAVQIAKDDSFVRYYSPIEYLGSVKIVSATD